MLDDLDEDVREHIEIETRDNIERGMAPEEARYAALQKFGNVTKVMEETREVWTPAWLPQLLQDVRYGLRQLRRNPSFTVVVIMTLALGIGANTAIFTVVNTILLHPLPYPDSGQIVNITRHPRDTDSLPMFCYWQQNNPGFNDLAAYGFGASSMNLGGGDRPELVQALKVSRNYFRLFGANLILGRTFSAREDEPGGPEVLVLSYGLWQRRFDADPSILGRTITLGDAPYVVIGVLSPGFRPYPSTDVWIPLQADPNSTDQAHILMVSGRLPRGATLAQANSWMAVIGKRYVQTHPKQLGNDDKLEVTPMQQQMTGDAKPELLILLGAVGLVLLISCANVASLLLARALGRQREIAIRSAIGAGRARIVRQLLTESLLLALAGGALGLGLGSWGVRALVAFTPGGLPRIEEMARVPALDPRVAGFSLLLSMMTAILFGLLPALQLSRTDLAPSLKESSGRAGTSFRQSRTRHVLVGTEMAIAAVLLCGAMLLIRTFIAMHSVPPGFDPHNLLTMKAAVAGPGNANSAAVDRLARQTIDRVEHIPGVEAAAVATSLPTQPIVDMIFDIPGRPPLKGAKFTGDVLWSFISWNYFDTLRIPLRSGRLFREQEPAHTVIVNEAMARKFWPKQNPVGQSIVIDAGLGPLDQGSTEIVGVVGDVHDRLDANPPPTMYRLWSQVPDSAIRLVSRLYPASIAVRTKPGVVPMSVSKAVRQALLAGATELPVTKVKTMDQVLLDSTGQQNFSLPLLGVFAAIALALAAVGIYGVMAYSVTERTHEIGVCVALGAERSGVVGLVVRQGIEVALVGIVVGLAAALGLTRLMASLLYNVKPYDPLTLVVVAVTLSITALLACWVPALKAARVDPIIALRSE